MDMAVKKVVISAEDLSAEALLGVLRKNGGTVLDLAAYNQRSPSLVMRDDAILSMAPEGFKLQWRAPVNEPGNGFNEALMVAPVNNPEGARARFAGTMAKYKSLGMTESEAKALYNSPYSHKTHIAEMVAVFMTAYRAPQTDKDAVSIRFMFAVLAMSPAWKLSSLQDRRPEGRPRTKGFAPKNPHDGTFERWKETEEGAYTYGWLAENIHEFSWYKCRILVGHLKVIFDTLGYSGEALVERVQQERSLWM